MKIYGMPTEAKSYKWIVAHEYKGKMWFVNAWDSYNYARSQAIIGGYKVYSVDEIE